MLGERTTGAKHLEQAVSTFKAALEELHLESVSMIRALTLYHLGNALSKLGERTGKGELFCAALDKHLQSWEVFENTPNYAELARNGVIKDIELLNGGVPKLLSAKDVKKCKEKHQSALSYLQNPDEQSDPLGPWLGMTFHPFFKRNWYEW